MVILGEHFVFLEDHRAGPGGVVDREVEHPFMGGGLPHFNEQLFEVCLVTKRVLVEGSHFSNGDDFSTFVEEIRDTDVICKGMQGIQISLNCLV